MKRHIENIILIIIIANCFILLGCNHKGQVFANYNDSNQELLTAYDYCDWYQDIEDSSSYNCVNWIELDVWFKNSVSDFSFDSIVFDVSYDGQVIASNVSVVPDTNFLRCYYDTSCSGANLTENGFLAPGTYSLILRDGDECIVSSTCIVTADSGNMLSQKVIYTEFIGDLSDQIALRIYFDSDITPYSKTGFYITVSFDQGADTFVPEKYSVERADTFLTIRYLNPDTSKKEALISVYCGDGSFVCSETVELDNN